MTNQKGYALLLVLGAVVIIGLLVPPMAYQIISSSTQASTTERDVQLENMYDMGKQVGRRHVEAAVTGDVDYGGFDAIADATDGEVTWEDVENHFLAELHVGDAGESFEIENLDFHTYGGSVDVRFTRVEEVDDRLEIEYEVTPEINADASETVTETFYLGRIGGDGTDGGPGDWFDEEDGSIDDDMFGDDTVINTGNNGGNLNMGSDWENLDEQYRYHLFNGSSVTLPGTGNYDLNGPMAFNLDDDLKFPGSSSKTTISGNLYISDTLFDLKQDSTFEVKGDAFFNNTFFEFQHNRDAKACIDGNIYDYGGNTFQERSNESPVEIEFYQTDTCDFEDLDPRKVYYTGELKTGEPEEGDFITDLILEGTRGE